MYLARQIGRTMGPVIVADLTEGVADAIIAAGWQPHWEWLMGKGQIVKLVYPEDREGGHAWEVIASGLTYEQANAIVVEHNRAGER